MGGPVRGVSRITALSRTTRRVALGVALGLGIRQVTRPEAAQGKTVLKQVEVVRTYRSTTPIRLGPPRMYGVVADPYPSTITVSDPADGYVLKIRVTLHGLTHPAPERLRIALSTPFGLWTGLISETGDATAVSGLEITLADDAARSLSQGAPLTSGAFRPTCDLNELTFPTELYPNGRVTCTLQALAQTASFGRWQLWVHDDSGPSTGQFLSGWDLELTVRTTVRVKKRKKKRKH